MKIPFLTKKPTVSVIRLQGVIGAGQRGGPALSDAALAPVIERAFRRKKPLAVALAINSPGGSPVQSSLIAARIRRLSEETRVPVYAFVEDMAASGGYWLACAADEIWADESSVLGSIGVISSGFGFADLISRYGIERRVHTAGQSKSMLDPFRPEKPEDIARLNELLLPIHGAFKDYVRARRCNRLDASTDLFTGDVWTGKQAVALGIADGLGHLVPRIQTLYGKDVRLIPYGQRVSPLRRLGLSADDFIEAAERRAIGSQFGLGG
ncbi:S49 family peptidase [Paracoccus aminophilus]|uniref:Peptidase S49 n=1 Tax=Paracoccus aminophilus JCM 7686 TaxID=1367847 RepID=S5Y2W5_PARAH|nr:S49 family peptidase [Paracoccus aminophilus]AGT10080.1 peptidase S49 [Paracoccus aminophilus JCM 7686]